MTNHGDNFLISNEVNNVFNDLIKPKQKKEIFYLGKVPKR